MAQDHFQTPPDPKRGSTNPKISPKSLKVRAKPAKTCIVMLFSQAHYEAGAVQLLIAIDRFLRGWTSALQSTSLVAGDAKDLMDHNQQQARKGRVVNIPG